MIVLFLITNNVPKYIIKISENRLMFYQTNYILEGIAIVIS